jgi:hypothetical protein
MLIPGRILHSFASSTEFNIVRNVIRRMLRIPNIRCGPFPSCVQKTFPLQCNVRPRASRGCCERVLHSCGAPFKPTTRTCPGALFVRACLACCMFWSSNSESSTVMQSRKVNRALGTVGHLIHGSFQEGQTDTIGGAKVRAAKSYAVWDY